MEKITIPEPIPVSFLTADSIEYLDALLQIDKERYDQDWEIEIAAPERLREFLDAYDNQTRNDNDRFALMALIVCSFEDSTICGVNEDVWRGIRERLLDRFRLHQYTIMYWCCVEETDPENVWTITPLMRGVWSEGISA